MTREEAIDHLKTIGQYYSQDHSDPYEECEILTKDELDALYLAIKALEQEPRWIPVSEKYEHHIDHTDCIWYGNDSGCPVTCSQYRDGWNDAMEYVFKDGKGYQPYKRNENG